MQHQNGNSSESAPRRRLRGAIIQRRCWTLPLWAKLMIFLALVSLFIMFMRGLYPFLAVSNPVPGGITVIEGWIHDINVEPSVKELDAAHNRDVFIVSAIPVSGSERESGRWKSEHIAAKLKKSGIPGEQVHLLFSEVSKKDRTYHSAMALKNWLQEQEIPIDSLNVITLGPHARRSRLLFQKAFGDEVKVGVIAIHDPYYDSSHWWRSTNGVGAVLYQSFAYMYAKFFFRP